MITESVIFTAFMLGIISACSLPLGTLSSAFWRPDDRTMAFLMAFGGGALLAALTIDLVASTVEKGYFTPLAIGCVIGGLLFVILNEVVNDYGGFVRKVSTTFYHLNRPNLNRIQRIFSSIRHVDVLQDLPNRDYRALSSSMNYRTYHKGSLIQRYGDPTEELYIIDNGKVELRITGQKNNIIEKLITSNVFNWMDFLVGAPVSNNIMAATDVNVWVIPRGDFFALVPNSSLLLQKVHTALRSEAVLDYLQNEQRLALNEAEGWIDSAVKTLLKRGVYSEAIVVERKDDEFIELADHIAEFSLFHNLPRDELEDIANHLVYKTHPSGTTFYHVGYRSDRMYFIARGEVSLIDSIVTTQLHKTRHASDAFGSLAFLTGSRHTTTAMTHSDTEVWVLRKQDLDEVLINAPVLASRLKQYLLDKEIYHYLKDKRHFDIDQIARWQLKVTTSIDNKTQIPNISELGFELNVDEHKGAPLAIWLGILLDGIPESLVIGASFTDSHISFSLLGGLFLSNYPEALSSSVSMRQHGFKFRRILWMWTSLMILTGIGAALGNIYFTGAEPSHFALVKGIAAGAMLTMIAQTMLPEAYIKGGSIIGFSTLLGFLATIFLKTLE